MTAERAFAEDRDAVRDEVHFRTWGTGADGLRRPITIANISARGVMARCEGDHQLGERITFNLPLLGMVSGVVRWSVLGRIGCEFDQMVDPYLYPSLLAVILVQPDRSSATPASRSNK